MGRSTRSEYQVPFRRVSRKVAVPLGSHPMSIAGIPSRHEKQPTPQNRGVRRGPRIPK